MVVSPHLDDATLSCGGLIADAARRGADVVVVTVFNAPPTPPISEPAARFLSRCGLAANTAMEQREREDDAALALLGAGSRRLELPEALYRKDRDGAPLYPSDLAIFGDPSPTDDQDAVTALIAAEAAAVRPDLVFAPLGIGGHVDHVLVRRAAERLDEAVLHYEDVPYLLYDRCAGWLGRLDGSRHVLHACDASAWAAKVDAIALYTSQSQVLWYSPDTWREDLTAYATSIGAGAPAERFWSSR